MSWSFEFVAESADAAKSRVDREAYIPDATKAAIAGMIDAAGLPPDSVLRVKSNGHIGRGGGNALAEVQVWPLVRAAPAPTPAPEPAP